MVGKGGETGMKRGESEVTKREDQLRACTRFRRGKILFIPDARQTRIGISIRRVAEGKKRRYGGKYWYGENFKVNRARDCRSKINWWKANNTLEFGGVAWSAGWKEDGGCWARQRLVRRRD